MVNDRARGVVVCFGGWSAAREYLNDSWGWNGEGWRQLADAGPAPRASYGLAYDDAGKTVILFGGRGACGIALAGTWEWDGTTWRKLLD